MIVKFRKQKRGVAKNPLRAAKGATGYLLGNRDHKGRERAFKPVLLSGSPDEFEQIVGFGNKAGQYTSGGLYFEETREQLVEKHGSNQAVEKMLKDVMERFEETLFPGLDKDQYCGVWILHEDKSNIELNFLFSKEELRSGKRLNPYYHKEDLPRINAFKDIINDEYKLSDPDTPDKKRASTPELFNEYKPVDLMSTEQNRRQFKQNLSDELEIMVQSGIFKNRNDMVEYLKEEKGLEVSRQTKKTISVINPYTNKPARLTGAIFEEGADYKQFSSDDYIEELMRRYEDERLEKINNQKELYKNLMDGKRKDLINKYNKEIDYGTAHQRNDFKLYNESRRENEETGKREPVAEKNVSTDARAAGKNEEEYKCNPWKPEAVGRVARRRREHNIERYSGKDGIIRKITNEISKRIAEILKNKIENFHDHKETKKKSLKNDQGFSM